MGKAHTNFDAPAQLTPRQRQIIFSPLRLVVVLGLSVFLTEILLMSVLDVTNIVPKRFEVLVDAAGLTTVLFLILYFYLFRPLVSLVHDCQAQELQLKSYQNHLEHLVRERTVSLEAAYSRLQDENENNFRNKQALLESEERFRQIFENSADAIVLFEPEDGSIIDLNPTAEVMFRKSKGELLAGRFDTLFSPNCSRQMDVILSQIVMDGTPGIIDKLECVVAPSEPRILSFRGKIITLSGRRVVYTTFRDITARIRMEQEAREIQAHLIHVNRMTTLGTMVSSVAHEINNPNNFLLMNTTILKRAWDDIAPIIEERYRADGDFPVAQSSWSEARTFLPEAIDGIQQGAQRISGIVDTLKSFGRDQNTGLNAIADVNDVVQLATAILNQVITRSTHNFRVQLAEGLPKVRGSARQLEQVVINLIQNALQALPSPDRGVSVVTEPDPGGSQVLIRVSDEGTGIPPELAARVMEPFFTTRLEQGGTGLGLAISATIVKENGGQIEFTTAPGEGTSFTVRLCAVSPAVTTTSTSEANHGAD